jgi:hypothetical protein
VNKPIHEPRYPIGLKFKPRGKHAQVHTITDILRTYNAAGELVAVRYVTEHTLAGHVITSRDICETTILMGTVQP